MINYTVKSGDTLSGLAYKYQTTISIIMGDNPIITHKDKIQIGWVLKIRTSEEYAKDKANAAKNNSTTANGVQNAVAPPSSQGATVKQIGVITLKKDAWVYKLGSKKELIQVRKVKKNEGYKVYGTLNLHGGLYNVGSTPAQFIKAADGTYKSLPSGSTESTKPNTSTSPSLDPNTPAGGSFTSYKGSIPQFERPGYRRPLLQVTSSKGSKITMELRILSVTIGYSNQLQANRTNAGWLINVMGQNLPTLNISGFFLDSRANREVDNFMSNYNKYFIPGRSDNYYSMAICTFLYKNVEYKGLIASLNVQDVSNEPITRKFSMSFIVLKEKALSTAEIDSYVKKVDRRGEIEGNFLSNLAAMLANPIIGDLGKD